MLTDFREFLRSRRSIRRFKAIPISDDIINNILLTATHAPSAHNRQPWRYAVLKNPEPKIRLCENLADKFRSDLTADNLSKAEIDTRINRSKNRIKEAPLIIILCMDLSEMDIYPDEKRSQAERIMAIQSVAAAGCQLQLAAQAEGLASVWTCSPLFAPETVQTALNLPANWQPQAMFFIGYQNESPKPKILKPQKEICLSVN